KPGWPRRWVLPGICVVGCAIGVLYCSTGGGLNLLGFTDELINGPMGILVVALAECIVVGWAWKGRFVVKMREHANERSDWKLYAWWDVIVKYVAPGFLVALIVWSIADFVYAKKWLVLVGSGVFILIPVAAGLLVSRHKRAGAPAEDNEEDDVLAWRLLVGAPAVAIVLGSVIGGARLILAGPASEPEAIKTVAEFVPMELGITAYVILAIVLVVIFGGLAWCCWKAMQPTGRVCSQEVAVNSER
ncbi:hypothetical protein ACFLQR_03485, partial [Verrucomicrobiota bacterium]